MSRSHATSSSSSPFLGTGGSISAIWSLVGYIAGAVLLAIPIGGLFLLTKTSAWRRRKRIRFAGWAPWWYVGGQPDVPEELRDDRRRAER